MSPQEKSRFDRLSQDDQLKLKAVMQMIQKEKDSKKNMKEDLDSFTYIDGLLDQNLVKQFVATFEAIYADISEQGEFERNDVAEVLASYMINRGSKWREMNMNEDRPTDRENPKGIGQLYVQPAVVDEIGYHIDTYKKGVIDIDDMIQAIEEILYGRVKAPGKRFEASGEIGVDQQGDTTRDINVTDDASMYDPLKENLKDLAKKSGIKLSDLLAKIKSVKDKEKDQIQKDAFKGSALAEDRSPEELLRKIEKDLRDRYGDKYSDMEIQLFMDSLGRDIKRGEFDGVETMYEKGYHYEDFEEYIIDKRSNLEEVDEGKEWFQKIGGITPLKGIGNGGLM